MIRLVKLPRKLPPRPMSQNTVRLGKWGEGHLLEDRPPSDAR